MGISPGSATFGFEGDTWYSAMTVQPSGWREAVVSGPPEEIADSLRSFREIGFTQVDIMLGPGTIGAIEAMAPVLDLLRAD